MTNFQLGGSQYFPKSPVLKESRSSRRVNLQRSILISLCYLLPLVSVAKPNYSEAYSLNEAKRGKVQGTVVDSKDGTGVAFANVILYTTTDDKLASGAITKENGSFVIRDLTEGNYYLMVRFVGYQPYRSKSISINASATQINLEKIKLQPSDQEIGEVNVTAQKRAIVHKMDKKIINASSFSGAAGGTAVDILENAPSVSVDLEGNVSLRGSESFTVFIDGKPSLFTGSQALEQVPSSQVNQIEIITNPSARYDAEGTAGIINIVTKKESRKGWNGLINVSGSTVESNSGDLVLTKQYDRFYWKFGGRRSMNYRKGEFEQMKETLLNDTLSRFSSWGDRVGRNYNTSGILGFGFFSDDSSLDFEFEGGDRGSGYEGNLEYEESYSVGNGQPYSEEDLSSYDYKDLNEDFVSGNINFQHTFGENKQILSANLFGIYGSSMEYFENALTRPTDGSMKDGQHSWEEEYRVTLRGKADYVYPWNADKGKWELGYLFDSYIEDGDYGMEDYDEPSDEFIYRDEYYSVYRFKRDIHSLYSILSNTVGSFSYQIGVRGEYTYRLLDSSDESASHTENRFDLFPSGHIAYMLPSDHQISASYSRRTVRPRLHYLEPYVTFADSYTARTGNPAVRPEYVNSYELGWQKLFDQDLLSLEVFHRRKKDKIERIRTVYRPNVTLDSISNVGNDFSTGAEAMALFHIFPSWTLNTTANLFYYRIESDYKIEGIDDESLNWQLRFSNSFVFGKSTRVQFDGNYVGPSVSTQGTREAFFYANASLRQQMFKRRLSATLAVRDVLKTAEFKSLQTGDQLLSETKVTPYYPTISLSLSYRINQWKQKESKRTVNDDLFEGSSH